MNIRHIAFSFATLVFLFSTQLVSGQGFTFGLVAGTNVNFPYHEGSYADLPYINTSQLGYNLNLHLGYKSGALLGISVEPGFTTKSHFSELESSASPAIKDYSTQFSYFNVPVLVDLYILENLSLSVGPEPAYMLRARTVTNDIPSQNISGLYERFEMSGVIGAQYTILANLDVGLRYSRAFTPFLATKLTNQSGNPIDDAKEYNQYIQALLRYRIISGEKE